MPCKFFWLLFFTISSFSLYAHVIDYTADDGGFLRIEVAGWSDKGCFAYYYVSSFNDTLADTGFVIIDLVSDAVKVLYEKRGKSEAAALLEGFKKERRREIEAAGRQYGIKPTAGQRYGLAFNDGGSAYKIELVKTDGKAFSLLFYREGKSKLIYRGVADSDAGAPVPRLAVKSPYEERVAVISTVLYKMHGGGYGLYPLVSGAHMQSGY
jgi:hypothetical protein